MKKRILCAILSLAAVFSLIGFNATQAWFSEGENKSMELKSGNLDFTATGKVSLEDENIDILPGATLNLAEAIVITNNSSIDTELRILVDCSYEAEEGEEALEWDSSWIEFVFDGNGSDWVQEGEFIYYRPDGNGRIPAVEIAETTTQVTETTTETTTAEAEALAEGEETSETTTVETTTAETTTAETTTTRVYAANEIPFAGKIRISKDVPPEFNNKTVNFNFTIQARQADFMEWTDFVSASETEVTTENVAS